MNDGGFGFLGPGILLYAILVACFNTWIGQDRVHRLKIHECVCVCNSLKKVCYFVRIC